jgi:hypothetical protein
MLIYVKITVSIWLLVSEAVSSLSPLAVKTYDDKNVKLFLCLIKHHTVKMYGGVEIWLHVLYSWYLMEMSGQLHAPGALSMGKQPLVSVLQNVCVPEKIWINQINFLKNVFTIHRP